MDDVDGDVSRADVVRVGSLDVLRVRDCVRPFAETEFSLPLSREPAFRARERREDAGVSRKRLSIELDVLALRRALQGQLGALARLSVAKNE